MGRPGSRVRAAQLRTAAQVREAYWAWQRAHMDHALAAELLSGKGEGVAAALKAVRGNGSRAQQFGQSELDSQCVSELTRSRVCGCPNEFFPCVSKMGKNIWTHILNDTGSV